MEIAHHALELFDAPPGPTRDAIRHWLAEAGFKISPSAPSDMNIRARRGSAVGITDQQTERVMEVIIRGIGEHTAVSIYHHTARKGPVVGWISSDLLRDEVNALLASLSGQLDKMATACHGSIEPKAAL